MTKNKQDNKKDEHLENEEVNVQSPENSESSTEEKTGEEQAEDNGNAQQEEIERLKVEISEAKEKYLRLYSEFENFRRRSAREKLDMVQTANQELVKDMLPVLDDFERAASNYSEKMDVNALKEGMDLIANKFSKVLEQKGVKPMDTKEGTDFDPEIHEAITQIPASKDELKGKVVDVVEKGYYLHDKVIRFAKVIIGG